MSHGPNRYRSERRAAELAARRAGPFSPAVPRARRIIAAWNASVARGPVEFFPTFETALAAGYSRLAYVCPACRQRASADLRAFTDDHHPRAPISVLIPKLSCKWCCPNPPLALLCGLELPASQLQSPTAGLSDLGTDDAAPRRISSFAGTTLGDLIRNDPRWLWLHCENIDCRHARAVAVVPFVIRWGADAPSDRLRLSMRCTKCGHQGATINHPAWTDANSRWQPFPTGGDDK